MTYRAYLLVKKPLLLFCAVLTIFFLPWVWLATLLLFSPILLFSWWLHRKDAKPTDYSYPLKTGYIADSICFNRLDDVSKLFGCDTRNVKYRWTVFLEALHELSTQNRVRVSRALDYGAGSLRDSYELCRLGFQVSACDLDKPSMEEGLKYFQWRGIKYKPDLYVSLADLPHGVHFDVITAFDVIEHLWKPEIVLQ